MQQVLSSLKDLLPILNAGSWIALAYFATHFFIENRKLKLASETAEHTEDVADRTTDHTIHVEQTRLTFEILSEARAEIARLTMDLARLRPLEVHALHLQEAMQLIEDLMRARTDEERELANKNARAFLNRMRRLSEAVGTIANETQRTSSGISLAEGALHLPATKPEKDG